MDLSPMRWVNLVFAMGWMSALQRAGFPLAPRTETVATVHQHEIAARAADWLASCRGEFGDSIPKSMTLTEAKDPMNVRKAPAPVTRRQTRRTASLGDLIAAIYDAATELNQDARQASVLAIDALADTLRRQNAGVAIGHGNA